MPKINSFNYNDPVNDKTILYIKPGGCQQFYKSFNIMKNIWIIPERNVIGTIPQDFLPPTSLKNGDSSYYDPNYLQSNEEKDRFLKIVTKIFNRINDNLSGRILLEELSKANPYLGNDNTPDNQFHIGDASAVEIKFSNGNQSILLPNVIIMGAEPDLFETNSSNISLRNNYMPSNHGFGSIAIVTFSPEYSFRFNDNSMNEFIQDPALTLMHELIHSLHGLYGAKRITTKYTITQQQNPLITNIRGTNIEEFLTFGGTDLNIITSAQYNDIYTNLLADYKKIASKLSKVQVSNPQLNPYKDIFQEKYGLDKNASGIYSVNINKFDDIFKKLYSFTEFDLATKFQVKCRQTYIGQYKYFKLSNLLNNSIYNISEGYNINTLKVNFRGQNTNLNPRIITQLTGRGLVKKIIRFCKNIVFSKGITKSICIEINNGELFFVASENSYNDDNINTPKEIDDTVTSNNNYENDLDQVILNFNSESAPGLSDEKLNLTIQNDAYIPKYDSNGTSDIEQHDVNELNVFFYLDAQKVPEGENNVNLTSSIDTALLEQPKIYTFFSSEFINNVNKPVQAALFVSWIQQVLVDFTTEANQKSTVDKIADISIVVPYIGLALNIGNEAQKGNFKDALELLGAGILLEFEPELLIPTILVFTIKSFLGSSDNKNKVIKAINNALKERDEKWKEVYSFIVSNWMTKINTQFNKRKEQMYQALQNQVNAIKTIIESKYNSYTLEEKNELTNKYDIKQIENELNQKVSIAMNNIDRFLTESSISYLMKLINEVKINKLREYDENVKTYLLNYIIQHGSILGESQQELNSMVTDTLNNSIPFKLSSYTDDKILISYFNKFFKRIKSSSVLNMRYKNDKYVDTSGYDSNININGDVYKYPTNKNQFGIYNDKLSEVNISQNDYIIYDNKYKNFSISFWVRIPNYDNKIVNVNNEYTIINCMRDNNSGWKVSLNHNEIIWTLQDNAGINQKLAFNYGNANGISDYINKWIFVTITNDRLGDSKLYINGNLIDQKSILNLGNIHVSDNILFKIVNCSYTRYIGIRYFNIFDKELDETEIQTLYSNEPNTNILKDFWGNYLLYDKEYYLLNVLKPNNFIDRRKDSTLSINNIRSTILLANRLYSGIKVKIQRVNNSSTNDNLVRKNDQVYINFVASKTHLFPLYADTATTNKEKTIKISSSGNRFNQVVVMNSVGNNCTMNFKNNNGNNIGLLGFKADTVVASTWYYTHMRDHTNSNGCFWNFISEEHGWQEK
uniref:Botulinum neurotoxin E n=1 Tax=Clostridium botulinum TaxID=1491 RepID=G8I2N7_CLOBO|nr:botulinum neurotoxin E [Clostridium botulinum]AFV91342.1 botulinum neurotoxin type E [Clostridium botulinum]